MCDKFSMRCSYRAARLSAAGFASFAAVVLMALLPVRAANIKLDPCGEPVRRLVSRRELGRDPADEQRQRMDCQRRDGHDHSA